jgi:hypothetical protein
LYPACTAPRDRATIQAAAALASECLHRADAAQGGNTERQRMIAQKRRSKCSRSAMLWNGCSGHQ